MLRVVYMGEYALAGWIALIVVAGIALTASTTAWVNAKTFMLSSPVLVLLAWGGIAGLRVSARRLRYRWALPLAIVLPALVLAGGIGVSDALQYHASNLAPTARYDELEAINRRFAGRGPTLVTDFDEYTLYELRDMDVGGLDFMYPPVGLRTMKGHGYPVDLDHVPPAALRAYPLIVTRRDPTVSEPPSAYLTGVARRLLPGLGSPPRRPCGNRPPRPVEHAAGPVLQRPTPDADRRRPQGSTRRCGPTGDGDG